MFTQTPPNRQTDRPSLSSASSSARSSTTTTFPVHLDRPTSTNQQYQQGYRGHSFGLQPQQHHNPFTSHSSSSHSSQRRRPQSPTRAYLNPLFLGSNPSSTTWYNGSKKHQNGWYAKMLEFVRRCWRSRPTHRTSDEEPSSSSRGHKRTQSEVPGKERTLRANAREYNETLGYADNYIKTSKYNLITFLPKNLFEQFRRLANTYFLVLMILQVIPQISSIAWYSTAVPLVIVLAISAIKDGYDDIQRHRSDSQVNSRISYVVRNGRLEEEKWMNVKVGDVIRMENEHFIAADLLLLSTSEPHGLCYIETAELDGETNLKTRAALPETAQFGDIIKDISDFDGQIICEAPNNKLDRFEGRLVYKDKQYPLDNNKVLLRGCRLRNTRWCYGVVVFAGKETKLMMNSGKTKFKRTSLDRFLNILIMGIVLFLLAMCLICTILCGIWEWVSGRDFTVYLKWDDFIAKATNSENKGPQQVMVIAFLMFFSYIILLNTVVPISLYVSVEIIRFVHSVWINSDLQMYYEKTDTPARARTTTLNEELGQVQYVFSDKTGTLTQNIMNFNKCSINGRSYGDLMTPMGEVVEITDTTTPLDFSWNRWYEPKFKFYDPTLMDDTKQGVEEVEEFWRLLAICHTVMPERKAGTLEYQAQSPDEAALTSAARNFGFVFKSRTPSSITIEVKGKEETFEVLQILDFDNVRKRMSVIIRHKDGKIKLYCKGADTMILARLSDDTSDLLRQATMQHLDKFATDGLRTLCCGYKEIDQDYIIEWGERQHEAALDMKNKDERLAELYEEIEKGMTLLGATAIEDKLQDGVPETIAKLIQANIKVWVLTGDKTETAINIGYSCRLLTEDMKEVFVVDGKEEREIEVQLKDIKRRMDKTTFTSNKQRSYLPNKVPSLVNKANNDHLAPNIRAYINDQIQKVIEYERQEKEQKQMLMTKPSLPLQPVFTLHDNQRLADENTNVVGASSFYDHPKTTYNFGNRSTSQVAPIKEQNGLGNVLAPPMEEDLDLPPQEGYGLVINGEALGYALKRKYEKLFLEIGSNCSAVICCRVTPLQKAQVVDLVKRHKKAVTLSIGDGANDVSMIKTAHIGVGISGQEGMQAVLSSDYSIGQFRYLQRLLLVHGRWSYFRMCKFLRYFFYKNFSFTLTHFWYSFFCGYSAQTVYDAILIACYNMFFTALPVLAMGVFDQDVSDEYSLKYPKLYIPGQYDLFFNMRVFVNSVIHGMISSLVLFFIPYGALYQAVDHSGRDMNDYPMLAFTVFTSLIVVVTGQIMLDTSFWTSFNHFVIWGSLAFYIAVVLLYYHVVGYSLVAKTVSGISYGVTLRALSSPHFWFSLLLICVVLLLPVMMNRFFWFDTHPSYADRLRVRSKLPEYAEQDKKEPKKPQFPRTAATRRSRRGSLRSGYAFSHAQGFGALITKGTMFKNIEHLRTASNRSTSKNNLPPIAESPPAFGPGASLSVPQAFRSIVGGKLQPQQEETVVVNEPALTNATPIPAIQLPSTSQQDSTPAYSPTERSTVSSSLTRHSTPPLTNTTHNLVVNQDSNPLPSNWQVNPNNTVAARPSLDPSIGNRHHSIASTSSSTTLTGGVNIPVQPLGKYHARRATIEVDTDSDTEELTSRRRRPQQRSIASTSSSDQTQNSRHPPRSQSRKTRNTGTSPHYPTTTNQTTNFPVYQRHQSKSQKSSRHGDTLV